MPQTPPKVQVKKFSITTEERQQLENIQSIIGILLLQREGMRDSMSIAIMKIQQRLGLKESDAPAGFVRSIDFNTQNFEFIVTDAPKPPEPAKVVDTKIN